MNLVVDETTRPRGAGDAFFTAMFHPRTTERTSSRNTALYHFMYEDHQRIEGELADLLRAVRANDRDSVLDQWLVFERDVLSHLEAEEHYMLPAFATIEYDEAASLLAEHGGIRNSLLELGVAIELHTVRLEQIRDFIDRLHAHARREDYLLYRWADSFLGPGNARKIREKLGERLLARRTR